jgi:hypothetical protein
VFPLKAQWKHGCGLLGLLFANVVSVDPVVLVRPVLRLEKDVLLVFASDEFNAPGHILRVCGRALGVAQKRLHGFIGSWCGRLGRIQFRNCFNCAGP